MGKTAMCIQMLEIMNTGKVFKISELADLLDTNPRNIAEYRKELEECGYYIISYPGRYGGYQLDKTRTIPALKLLPEEKDALSHATNYLLSRNDFMNKEVFQKTIGKIYSSISNPSQESDVTVINRFPLAISAGDLQERFAFVNAAIRNKTTIRFRYTSLKNVEKDYEYDPYEIFMFNNAWFMIGWLHGSDSICYFKLNRMSVFENTTKKFKVLKSFDKSDYIDEYGFKNNGEWYHIEFKAFGPYASLVKERVYGKNQIIIPIDETTTVVKVDMQNNEEILAFILGFKKNVEVIEPEWLKSALYDYSFFLREKYKPKESE